MSTYRPKRSSIYLYDFIIDGVRHHGSTKCQTKRDADRFEAKLRGEIASDERKRSKPPRIPGDNWAQPPR